jgi:hypothetical protein
MKIFQSVYDKIGNWKAPDWYVILMQQLQDIILGILVDVAQENIQKIKVEIIRVSQMGDELNNQQKFQMVKLFCVGLLPKTKESAINLLIELLVSQLKKDRVL